MYYKVVSNSLESARYCIGDTGDFSSDYIKYKINEWVKPLFLKSKLFVFDNLESAKIFKHIDERIFECDVKNPVSIQYICTNTIQIKEFWDILELNQDVSNQKFISEAIPGTVLADEVMLIKEILD